MKRILLSFLLFPLLISASSQRSQQDRRIAKWAHDGEHVIVGGTWHDPFTWEEVEPVPAPKKPKRIYTKSRFKKRVELAGGTASVRDFGSAAHQRAIRCCQRGSVFGAWHEGALRSRRDGSRVVARPADRALLDAPAIRRRSNAAYRWRAVFAPAHEVWPGRADFRGR